MSICQRPLELLALPLELLEQVLFELHPLDVVVCRQISREFKELIDASIELQLRIELAVDGYLLNYRGHQPASELLRQVLARREALEELKPQWKWSIQCPNTSMTNFEVCDGIWAHCINMNDEGRFRGIHYEELISPEAPGQRWELEWHDLGMNVTDFSFCVAEDAQILMEMIEDDSIRRMHFRTMSTNEVHPSSAAPFLDILKSDCEIWTSCSTIANGNRLLLMFTDWDGDGEGHRGGALVLDWKSTEVIMPYRRVTDAAFVSEDYMLLLYNGENNTETITLDLYSLSQSKSVRQFKFPFSRPVLLALLMTHPTSHYGDKCPASLAKMFVPDPDLEIIGILLHTERDNGHTYLVAVSIRQLLQLHQKESDVETTLEWSSWGQACTRWLPPNTFAQAGFRSTFSSRMVTLERMYTPFSQWIANSMAVFDFNPRPIRRHGLTHTQGWCRGKGVREWIASESSSIKLEDSISDAPIVSSLPFRAWGSRGSVNYMNIFLDGNTMIGRKHHGFDFFSFLPDTLDGGHSTRYTYLSLTTEPDIDSEDEDSEDPDVDMEDPAPTSVPQAPEGFDPQSYDDNPLYTTD